MKLPKYVMSQAYKFQVSNQILKCTAQQTTYVLTYVLYKSGIDGAYKIGAQNL